MATTLPVGVSRLKLRGLRAVVLAWWTADGSSIHEQVVNIVVYQAVSGGVAPTCLSTCPQRDFLRIFPRT